MAAFLCHPTCAEGGVAVQVALLALAEGWCSVVAAGPR